MNPGPEWDIYVTTPVPRRRDHCGRGGGKMVRARGSGIACEIVSSRSTRSHTHKISPRWLPKRELTRDNCRHSKMNQERPMRLQPYTKTYGQLRNAKGRRNNLPQGKAYQHYSIPNGQPLKHTYTWPYTLYRLSKLYLYIYEHMHMDYIYKNI